MDGLDEGSNRLRSNGRRMLQPLFPFRGVWGVGYQGTDRTVDNFINRLRQKLDHAGSPRHFCTVRGVGYRLKLGDG